MWLNCIKNNAQNEDQKEYLFLDVFMLYTYSKNTENSSKLCQRQKSIVS